MSGVAGAAREIVGGLASRSKVVLVSGVSPSAAAALQAAVAMRRRGE